MKNHFYFNNAILELHYYAPNLRTKIAKAASLNKMSEVDISVEEGQASDIFSFGIILYEILYKKKAHEFPESTVIRPTYEGMLKKSLN